MSINIPATKPKRRVRYKGTHPRKFQEKYKEHNPDKYSQDVEKIKQRGSTPAGTHRPICVQEILEILQPRSGQVVLDATLGYGGHSWELLQKINPGGTLIALDQDPIERPKTEQRLRQKMVEQNISDPSLVVGAINFSQAWSFLRQQGIAKIDLVLADLGLSSMQIDTPERGFSFKVEASFDLRMNPEKGTPAWQYLESLSALQLAEVLRVNSDELYAEPIAAELLKMKPKTTTGVAVCVQAAMSRLSKKVQEKEGDAPIRRVFQALRILVNDEFAALDQFLLDLPHFLKQGGKVAILSFHSGEDRRVKKSFQAGFRSGIYSSISEELIRPSYEEQHANPRSKSAKLRWAQI